MATGSLLTAFELSVVSSLDGCFVATALFQSAATTVNSADLVLVSRAVPMQLWDACFVSSHATNLMSMLGQWLCK
jgi:hypothetical protein